MDHIKFFSEINIKDISAVGGKNASLGEMYSSLSQKGIIVPNGFAVTASGYRLFLTENNLNESLKKILDELDTNTFNNLSETGTKARNLILQAKFPEKLSNDIKNAYLLLQNDCGAGKSYAVRSSATAEDLPNASFAGQQETYLNVFGEDNLIQACHKSYASLFTDRAIKYRTDKGFDHMKVALSIGVQMMVRSDLASSGVMFTIEPDSGFDQVVVISGAWGLGENVVQGNVNTDEFMVFKPVLHTAKNPIISHKLGSKEQTMIYATSSANQLVQQENSVQNIATEVQRQNEFVISDKEVIQLAKWAVEIENHYKCPMDIEWAKDGEDGKLYIVQARPETVHSQKNKNQYTEYTLQKKGKILCKGAGIGNKIVSGTARLISSPSEISKLQTGDILVTERTDPDWDPVLQKVSAIVTDSGGRTSHAAIVARELGAIAVIGTGNATKTIQNGQTITISTASGSTGVVYDGELTWTEKEVDISSIQKTKTKAMLILAHPDEAFQHARLPNDGVGLMRMEFIINNTIGIHPMALKHFNEIESSEIRENIESITVQHANKEDYFIHTLAEATAKMAAAFYPKDVIVRMSDFKSNEYAGLLGGAQFEPTEENPMIGFRGSSRYYHPLYQDAFEMECKAMKIVRDEMGLTNVKLMIPFCRTIDEAKKVIEVMSNCGLKRKENGLELYVMIEIPSNAILAEEFAEYFDGFSIGSNDLTQLTLGADRDSELLNEIFSPFDPAVMSLIEMTLLKAKKTHTHTGLCGQAPSDYPEYAQFLVSKGIDSISFNPDALIKGIENIAKAESNLNNESAS